MNVPQVHGVPPDAPAEAARAARAARRDVPAAAWNVPRRRSPLRCTSRRTAVQRCNDQQERRSRGRETGRRRRYFALLVSGFAVSTYDHYATGTWLLSNTIANFSVVLRLWGRVDKYALWTGLGAVLLAGPRCVLFAREVLLGLQNVRLLPGGKEEKSGGSMCEKV